MIIILYDVPGKYDMLLSNSACVIWGQAKLQSQLWLAPNESFLPPFEWHQREPII